MKKSVALFKSHREAINALQDLLESGIDISHISLVGRAEIVDEAIRVTSNKRLIALPVTIGMIAGTAIGCMAGIGTITLPGLEAITGSGVITGSLAGFGLGVATGGLITMITELIVKEKRIHYKERVREGSFLMFINGSQDEIERAERVIQGKHLGLTHH